MKVGDTVAKGEVIATLERADARREVKVARLQLAAAAGASSTPPRRARPRPTRRPGSRPPRSSSSQVASAEAQVVQAQATLDDAEAALDATTLTAPISGTVLQVNGKVGSIVRLVVVGTSQTGARRCDDDDVLRPRASSPTSRRCRSRSPCPRATSAR